MPYIPISPSGSALSIFTCSALHSGKLPLAASTLWAPLASGFDLNSTSGVDSRRGLGIERMGFVSPSSSARLWFGGSCSHRSGWAFPLCWLLRSPSTAPAPFFCPFRPWGNGFPQQLLSGYLAISISFNLTQNSKSFVHYMLSNCLFECVLSCQDRKTKTLTGKSQEFWAQFRSVQFNSIRQTFTERGPLSLALCQELGI